MTTDNTVGVVKSAVCEKSLVDLTAPLKKGQLNEIFSKDELVLAPTVRPEQMQEIVRSVDEAINAPGAADETEVLYSSLMH
jgi:deoxyinosine 3'endonuclease (endonuclease V)